MRNWHTDQHAGTGGYAKTYDGPFIVQESPGGPDDNTHTYYVAIDPLSGIVTTGRRSRGEAEADRKSLNAAYWLGQSHAKGAR